MNQEEIITSQKITMRKYSSAEVAELTLGSKRDQARSSCMATAYGTRMETISY